MGCSVWTGRVEHFEDRLRCPALVALAVGGLFAFGACAGDSATERDGGAPDGQASAGARPNLVIVSLDTVRRDHVSLYGYPKATTPFLDSVAQEGWVFDSAFTVDTNTNPAHTSLLTGLHPHEHGSQENGMLLDASVPILAEVLSGYGYRTGAFVSGVPMREDASGLARGFDVYDDAFDGVRRSGELTTAAAIEWIGGGVDPGSNAAERPFFAFVHLYDAHGPYQPTAEELAVLPRTGRSEPVARIPSYQQLASEDGEPLIEVHEYVDRYDALIRRLDGLVASIWASLDLDDTFVLVTSDHGETFLERWYQLDHGAQVYDEQTRIPMVLVGPGLDSRRIEEPVSLVDFVPSIVPRLGVQWPAQTSGADWFGELPETRPMFSTARAGNERYENLGYDLVILSRIHSVRAEGWKLLQFPGREGDEFQLYDLGTDPAETDDVLQQNRERARRLFGRLREWNPGYRDPVRRFGLSDDLERQLESLGYLN